MKKLMKRFRKKLRSNAGESLAEVLIALLIAAFAMTLLATAIGSTAKVITISKDAMQNYNDANEYIAGQKAPSSGAPGYEDVTAKIGDNAVGFTLKSGGVVVSLTGNTGDKVEYFESKAAGDSYPVASYRLVKGAG